MSVNTSTKQSHLRMGVESGESQQDGVLVFDDIPIGATVHARVDRPVALNEASDLAPAATEVVAAGPPTLTWAPGPPPTVTRSAGSFIADGYLPGMRLIVDSPLNPGAYTIAEVTALVLTLVLADVLVAEGPLAGGETLNGGPVLVQPYTFGLAPLPAPYAAGGVTFGRGTGAHPAYPPANAPQNSRQRVLVADGLGRLTPEQHEPLWAGFTPPADGSLAQKGQAIHTMVMPGHPSNTPNLPPNQRNLLRMRWVGTSVVGATLAAVVAATQLAAANWIPGAGPHINLVPGSVVLTLPTSAGTLRDNGKGRLIGADGDGTIDYLTGAYSLRFNVAETGNVLATYEHGCLYRPLDVTLTFDPLQAH